MEDPIDSAGTGGTWVGNLTNNLSQLAGAAAPIISALKPAKPAATTQKPTTGLGATLGGMSTQTMVIIGVGLLVVIGGIVFLTRSGKRG